MAVISAPTSVCACVKKQETKAKIQSKDITQTKVHMNLILYHSFYPKIVNGKTENIYKP